MNFFVRLHSLGLVWVNLAYKLLSCYSNIFSWLGW